MTGQLLLIIKLIDILAVAIVTVPELLKQFNELRAKVVDMVERNVDPTRSQIAELFDRGKQIENALAARLAVLEGGETAKAAAIGITPEVLDVETNSTDETEE